MDKYLPILAPVLPTEATDEGHRAGTRSNPVKEDHVLDTGQHHITPPNIFVPDAKLDSRRDHPETFNTPSRDFPSEIGKGDEATPTSSRRCFNLPLRLSGRQRTSMATRHGSRKHPCQTDLVTGRPRSPHLCSLEKVDAEVIASSPGSFRNERG